MLSGRQWRKGFPLNASHFRRRIYIPAIAVNNAKRERNCRDRSAACISGEGMEMYRGKIGPCNYFSVGPDLNFVLLNAGKICLCAVS